MRNYIVLLILILSTVHLQAQKRGIKIVGGTGTTIDYYPYQVGLIDGGQSGLTQFCGGAIIGSKYIITATHCVLNSYDSPLQPSDIDILVGRTDLNTSDGEIFQSEFFHIHPNYNTNTSENDITIIELKTAIDLNDPELSAEKIYLVSKIDSANGMTDPDVMGTITGWGKLNMYDASGADELHVVQVPLVSNETASEPQSYPGEIYDCMLAAGYVAGGKDACQGDSGGPIVVPTGLNEFDVKLAGIVSWGDDCAAAHKYGIYSRISYYEHWIDSVVGDEVVFLVDKISDPNAVSIYPTPASNLLNISLNNESLDIVNSTIFNSVGSQVKSYGNISQIDISELSSGVYILNITTNKLSYKKRFIKQ